MKEMNTKEILANSQRYHKSEQKVIAEFRLSLENNGSSNCIEQKHQAQKLKVQITQPKGINIQIRVQQTLKRDEEEVDIKQIDKKIQKQQQYQSKLQPEQQRKQIDQKIEVYRDDIKSQSSYEKFYHQTLEIYPYLQQLSNNHVLQQYQAHVEQHREKEKNEIIEMDDYQQLNEVQDNNLEQDEEQLDDQNQFNGVYNHFLDQYYSE